MLSKVSSRLYFLKQLKRSGARPEDLLFLHHSDTSSLGLRMPSLALEFNSCAEKDDSLQQRAMKIIFPDKDYTLSLIFVNVDTLELRREQLTERFFTQCVLRKSSCLHYVLTDIRDTVIMDRLHHAKSFKLLMIRTEKFRTSFIPYYMNHYD